MHPLLPHELCALSLGGLEVLRRINAGRPKERACLLDITPRLLDTRGGLVPGAVFRLEHALSEPDGFRRYVVNVTASDIPPGAYTLNVRLRDKASGRVSEAFHAVEIQD